MISHSIAKSLLVISMLLASALSLYGCADPPAYFTKSPPTLDNAWADSAGGLPQR